MMKLKIATLSICLGITTQALANPVPCQIFLLDQNKEDASWRDAVTHPLANGGVKTNFDREWTIQQLQVAMVKGMENETPLMHIVGEAGARLTPNVEPDIFTETRLVRFMVSKIGSSGKLRGTLLLPVSTHTGHANSAQWAQTDTYDIDFVNMNTSQRSKLINQAKSLHWITFHEVEIQLVKGEVVRIEYARSGSGGVGGYPVGRVIEFEWDGT